MVIKCVDDCSKKHSQSSTHNPTTASKVVVAASRWVTAANYIAGSSTLVAGNIKKGVSILGVTGTWVGVIDNPVTIFDGTTLHVGSWSTWGMDEDGTVTKDSGCFTLTHNGTHGSAGAGLALSFPSLMKKAGTITWTCVHEAYNGSTWNGERWVTQGVLVNNFYRYQIYTSDRLPAGSCSPKYEITTSYASNNLGNAIIFTRNWSRLKVTKVTFSWL